jgi:hypothetical protein
MLHRPKTIEEYVDLVDQALFEVEELRFAAEYDMESLGSANAFVDVLEQEVRKLRASMADGSYQFGREDLPFMALVEKQDERVLPFQELFRAINKTHKEGLEVDQI